MGHFHKLKHGRFGLSSSCKNCKNAAGRRLYQSQAQKERDRGKVYRQANPHKSAERQRRRRARKRELPVEFYTAQEIYDRDHGICSLCGFDVDPNNYHVDHIVPLQVDPQLIISYRLGDHPGDVKHNVSISHPTCNYAKANRMTADDVGRYILWRYMYGE